MRYFFLAMLLLAPAAQATGLSPRDILQRIDYLHAVDSHRTSYVWDGRFRTLNGDRYNMQHLYQSKRAQVNAKLGVLAYEASRLRITIPMHFDNGFKADLYQAQPFLGIRLVTQWAVRERAVFGFHLQDALKFGGKVTETPCHDGFRRRFHCGTGLSWTDASQYLRQSNVATLFKFTIDWTF
tara:strand:+ start:1128 stop:1673 length:546 start_codon:yes stop_codon:yes gene_type:complete